MISTLILCDLFASLENVDLNNLRKISLSSEISNNVVCATSKDSDQPAYMHSLIRAFAWRLNIL